MPLMILGPLGLPRYSYSYLYIYIWSIYYHILSIYYHLYSHIPSNLCTFYWRKSLCARNTRQSFSNFGTELGTLLSRLAPEAQPVSRWDEKNMIATFINIRGMYIYSVYYVYIYIKYCIYIYIHTPELKISSWLRERWHYVRRDLHIHVPSYSMSKVTQDISTMEARISPANMRKLPLIFSNSVTGVHFRGFGWEPSEKLDIGCCYTMYSGSCHLWNPGHQASNLPVPNVSKSLWTVRQEPESSSSRSSLGMV